MNDYLQSNIKTLSRAKNKQYIKILEELSQLMCDEESQRFDGAILNKEYKTYNIHIKVFYDKTK